MSEKIQTLKQLVESLIAILFLLGTLGSSVNLVMRRIPDETYAKLENSHPAMRHLLRFMRKIFVDLWPAIQEAKEAIKAVKEGRGNLNDINRSPDNHVRIPLENTQTNNPKQNSDTEDSSNTNSEKDPEDRD